MLEVFWCLIINSSSNSAGPGLPLEFSNFSIYGISILSNSQYLGTFTLLEWSLHMGCLSTNPSLNRPFVSKPANEVLCRQAFLFQVGRQFLQGQGDKVLL